MSQRTSWGFSVSGALGSLLAVSVCLASAGQSTQPTTVDRAAANRGEATFRTYCGSCHGKQAKGDGPLANDLKVKPANLTELLQNNEGVFPFEKVVETIDHGRSVRGHGTEDMPAWGDAFKMTTQSEAEAKAKMVELANYLWTLQPKQ